MEALLLLVAIFILAPLLMHLLGLELTPKKKSLPRGASPAALDALRKCEPHAGVFFNAVDAPEWLRWLFEDREYRRLLLREWEDVEWRDRSGWKVRLTRSLYLVSQSPSQLGLLYFCSIFQSPALYRCTSLLAPFIMPFSHPPFVVAWV